MHNDGALNTVVCVPSDKRIFSNRTKDVVFLFLAQRSQKLYFPTMPMAPMAPSMQFHSITLKVQKLI